MTDHTNNTGCERYSEELAELALGVLTGRERVQALSHVESCPRCADELEQLSRVADTLVQVGPEVEPPVGFEVRLFEKMGVSDELARQRTRRHRLRHPGWVAAAVGVAAAAAVGLGLGLSVPSSTGPTVSALGRPHPAAAAAPLVENGTTVGRVATFVSGDTPWMSMMLADSSARGSVKCLVVTNDGRSHQVGTFEARKGYGAWIAPLRVDPKDIHTAEVVSPSGTVIATATLG